MTRVARWTALLRVGLATTSLCALAGLGLEVWRFGATDAATFARVEADIRSQIGGDLDALRALSARMTGEPALIAAARGDAGSVRALFDALATAVSTDDAASELAITVYGVSGVPLAWAGRPTEFASERLSGPEAVFTAPGPGGLHLAHVAPVTNGAGDSVRVASVVSERLLSATPSTDAGPGSYSIDSRLAPATLRTRDATSPAPLGLGQFTISAPDGAPLMEIRISQSDLAAARGRWRARLASTLLAMLALTALLPLPHLLALRQQTTSTATYRSVVQLLAGAAVVSAGFAWISDPGRWLAGESVALVSYTSAAAQPALRSSYDLLVLSALFAFLGALAFDAVERRRISLRDTRHDPSAHPLPFVAAQCVAGLGLAALLWTHGWFVATTIETAVVDLAYLSIRPWSPTRMALLMGLITAHAATLWFGIIGCLWATAGWRMPRVRARWTVLQLASWTTPVLLVAAVVAVRETAPSAQGLALSGVTCALAAIGRRRLLGWYRHASQAPRVLAAFVPLLVPALLLYPHLRQIAEQSKRELIELRLGPQAEQHAARLQGALAITMSQIDNLPAVEDSVTAAPSSVGPAPTDTAFQIWRQTDLARFRLTSAFEIYGSDGSLVSRFSMNLPQAPTAEAVELTPTLSCSWTVMAETSPFGSEERRLFHAERAICTPDGQTVGIVRVHALVDYGTLPFISSKSPYFDLFQTTPRPFDGSAPGRDVELVIYGWGRRPSYTSSTGTWPLDEAVFERLVASRDRFWTTVRRDGTPYHVYFSNDRAGIYALGYPATGTLEQVVDLAEVATLAGLAYVVFLGATVVLAAMAGRPATSGRVILREIRASFSRRLFLAFVATSVIPLLILAFVMRSYFANRLRIDVEAEAARTAAVVQRVIEEALAVQRSVVDSPASISDDAMVWIGKVIGQDVNIFEGPRLIATNQRDLFASGLLPTRTPPEVYRAIALQRQPRFVGEDVVGAVRYMLVATPVRLGPRSAILTVPHALRQQEIEAEIDELDRRVYLTTLIFSLLGAALGLSMAERIADPVRRLTRATQRIARGDFDAALATRSVDELQRLVVAFNRMAGDLKHQRDRLERTHRLEAWAEMARQVAHEIKNPLTPIQLSAEHLRRVHADRGEPLGSLLNSCVDSILTQVRLLRQIASEFSTFASSPTPHPARVAIGGLLREVVDPYRPGVEPRVVVETTVADSLPTAFVDRTLVARALTNLIENALHSIDGAGTLRLIADQADDHVRVRVIDSGVGMDEEAVRRAFEPYFSTKATGTGLGLTIAKRNIEAMHGTIALASRKGEGTTVTLSLPSVPPDRSDESVDRPPATSGS